MWLQVNITHSAALGAAYGSLESEGLRMEMESVWLCTNHCMESVHWTCNVVLFLMSSYYGVTDSVLASLTKTSSYVSKHSNTSCICQSQLSLGRPSASYRRLRFFSVLKAHAGRLKHNQSINPSQFALKVCSFQQSTHTFVTSG